MKSLPSILLAVCGLLIGWFHPTPASSNSTGEQKTSQSSRDTQRSSAKYKELLSELLNNDDQQVLRHKTAQSPFDVIGGLEKTYSYSSADIQRIVTLGAEAALSELLTDPDADPTFCEDIAKEWALQEPEKALNFFRKRSSFRSDNCLAAALPSAFGTHPDLVMETIRAMPINWQRLHLKNLISADYRIKKTSPQFSQPSTDDPFSADDTWVSKPLGEEIIDAFLDPSLQRTAHQLLEPRKKNPASSDTAPDTPLDRQSLRNLVTSYRADDAWLFDSPLNTSLTEDNEATLSAIVEHGNFDARSLAMDHQMKQLFRDEKEWPDALRKLEAQIKLLKVIPSSPPSIYPVGRFLYGEIPAKWIAEQSPALQRSWTPDFVEFWAQREPAKALNWSLSLPKSPHRDLAIQQGIIIWAHQTPAEAQHFVQALPPGDLRESSISNAAASWSLVDPNGARQWLNTLPESPGKQRALKRLK